MGEKFYVITVEEITNGLRYAYNTGILYKSEELAKKHARACEENKGTSEWKHARVSSVEMTFQG